jgi:hypothetical protein
MRNHTRRLAGASAVLAVAFIVGGLATAGVALADDGDNGTNLTVVVGPTDGADTGTGSSGGSGSSGSGSGSSGSGSTSPTPSVSATPAPSTTPKPGDVNLGGILYLSGVTSDYIWSIDPTHTAVMLHLTVRNVSKSTFDSTARFWIDTPLGNTVSEVKGIQVAKLRPNETRELTVKMVGLGQWTVLHAHATLTPPKVVDGVTLTSVTRDSYVFVPPILAGAIGLLGVGAFFLGKFLLALRFAARARGIV